MPKILRFDGARKRDPAIAAWLAALIAAAYRDAGTRSLFAD